MIRVLNFTLRLCRSKNTFVSTTLYAFGISSLALDSLQSWLQFISKIIILSLPKFSSLK